MTDQVRAALEALLSQWDAEAGAMPDSRVRTVLQSCAMEVRAILLDPVIARAALAAASPEPERCAYRNKFGDPVCVLPPGHPTGHTSVQPAPAAPTVEALRDDIVRVWLGWLSNATGSASMLRADLDRLIAAIRADERTRLSGEQGR